MTNIIGNLKKYLFISKNIKKIMSECIEGPVNPLKRQLQTNNPEAEAVEKRAHLDIPKVKRKKTAVLLCYSGQGYLGLQRNPGTKTIEQDFLSALLKAGIINEEAHNNPKLVEFQRAARTDKGVSAVRQVLSLKLPLEICLKTINEYLPSQIRMVTIKRATKGFNCKGNCDARTYSYTMPTFSLSPKDEPPTNTYRVPPTVIEETNKVLLTYLGTHNYHNFTSRKKPLDPSTKRYIISFTCGEPFVIDNVEFVTLKVKGQSFMLHQIRKMVGLTIAIIRGIAPAETIVKAFGEERLDLPVAPGVGLILEEVHYDRYNNRFGNDGIHEPIEWSSVEEELEEFKKEFILPTIIKAEVEDKSMLTWLESLPLHTFDVRHGARNGENTTEDANENSSTTKEDLNGVVSLQSSENLEKANC